jgi:hypothetical protein
MKTMGPQRGIGPNKEHPADRFQSGVERPGEIGAHLAWQMLLAQPHGAGAAGDGLTHDVEQGPPAGLFRIGHYH